MTDSERLEILWAAHEDRQAADERLAAVTGRPARLTADVTPRPPFDWNPFLAYLFRGLILLVSAVAAYYGVDASQKAGHAVVQGEKNATAIKDTHTEVERHGRQIDRVMGNVADRVPGK